MSLRRCVLPITLLGTFVLTYPTVSDAQLVRYDNFAGPLIDPSKWFGSAQSGGPANPTTEIVRQISAAGLLELRLNQYGLSNSDNGTSDGFVRLRVTNPAPITTLQAKVIVASASAEACPTNSFPGLAQAEILGRFFNDGSSTGPSDQTGDIHAGIVKSSFGTATGNTIDAYITRCSDSTCSSVSLVATQRFVTTWAPGQPHTLRLEWDSANTQFVYSVLGTETIAIPYTQSDTNPAVAPFRMLAVHNRAVNCTGSQKHAFMDVFYRNVKVNP